ncbi:Amt family ammonium transporter [Methanococcus voltae]|uniref:ammonium transporter n=1 Tax=Methanococcus voltae TaxID=2188 RepID=UPI001AE2C263|nr:Amt family ammonium transporter [Methanococcus voltae]
MAITEIAGGTTNIAQSLASLASAGDVMFLVFAGVLVFAMQLGFALLEGGQVREKNVNNVMMKNMTDWMIAGISWLFVGYVLSTSLNLGDLVSWWGNILSASSLSNLDLANWFFGLTFAGAASTIVSGGVAERIKFSSYILIAIVITALIYPIWVHIGPWGAGLLQYADYAGSYVVHGLGGFLALGLVIALGPRAGRFVNGKPVTIAGHNIPMATIGAFVLAIGWYGFNVGSSFAVADISGVVIATTTIAMAGGGIGALLASKNDVLFTANGIVAGLVAICAGTNVVSPIGALVIGLLAGIQLPFMYKLIEKFGVDDVCGVVPVHGTAGILGGVLTGVFGLTALGGLGGVSLLDQVIAAVLTVVFGVTGGYGLGKLVGVFTKGLRVTDNEELVGLDISEHKLPAYPGKQ